MNGPVRPWGGYAVLLSEPGIQVKRIHVAPGKRFSLQRHQHRSERWIVVSGSGVATVGDREIAVAPGSILEILQNVTHRMQCTGPEPLVFIEVQLGNYLGEDDIIRLEDDFGRV